MGCVGVPIPGPMTWSQRGVALLEWFGSFFGSHSSLLSAEQWGQRYAALEAYQNGMDDK